ncbi:hypothetical protein BJV82DRAFT_654003 [Fennellomyces sp. T-0311]|nr:hypothetical protein BJV82DRAFT_654003 [Fennellomyces sp. T-0311]
MFTLPSDIVFEIFSYLNKEDCLVCMAVCRDWYGFTPQYAQSIWMELQLDPRDLSVTHGRRERCLGSHVETVTIGSTELLNEESYMYALMQKLQDWGCTGVTSLELLRWSITDQAKFLSSLAQLAPHLTHLKLTESQSSIMPTFILDTCSELTHFSCRECNFLVTSDDIQSSKKGIDYPSKITHLVLDAIMEENQIVRVLKRCPELRSLIGIGNHPRPRFSSGSISTNLDLVFSWCPKITVLRMSQTNYSNLLRVADDPNAYISDQPGLRYFNAYSTESLDDQLARHLTRNQRTLEFLSIRKTGMNISFMSAISSLKLPKLRTMIFRASHCNANPLIALLNHCPSLEILDLDFSFDLLAVTHPLDTMHRLRVLFWRMSQLPYGFSLNAMLNNVPALEKLVIANFNGYFKLPTEFTGLKRLKHLEVNGSGSDHNHTASEVKAGTTHLFDYLARNASLEVIRFSIAFALDCNILQTIATIPTLKVLDIYLETDSLHGVYLAEFIRTLSETAIESLVFRNIRRLPYIVLDSIADLPQLTAFAARWDGYIAYATRISKEGLQRLLSKKTLLTIMSFDNPVIAGENGNPISPEQVNALVNQETVQDSDAYSKGRWDVQLSYRNQYSTQKLSNVTIRRE